MGTGFRSDSRRWQRVWTAFLFDGGLVWVSFAIGIWVRFGSLTLADLLTVGPGVLVASLILPSLLYVGGFYSPGGLPEGGSIDRLRWIFVSLGAVLIAILAFGSVDFSSRVGRGVLLVAFSILVVAVLFRHLRLARFRAKRWERILCLATSREDEIAAEHLSHLWGQETRHFGLIVGKGYRPVSALSVVGCAEDGRVFESGRVDVLLVRDQHLADPVFGPLSRKMRYEGTEIVSLADACEEAFQAIPLGLVTESWLFRASHQPGLFYIRKMKRLFDIGAGSFFLLVLSPFMLLGMLLVKISSRGPVLFRQVRAGRMERPFTVYKIRTMRVEDCPRSRQDWAKSRDPRIFPVGAILRKFRIDEIPQLFNVIKGEMSFVGPRPEQAALIETLNGQIPYYRERLLIQPGLTGWAQVKYPYGASIEDSIRKLEYDLYYMKHMSLFLDFFILIETVKIVLCGGVGSEGDGAYRDFRNRTLSATEDEVEGEGKGRVPRVLEGA